MFSFMIARLVGEAAAPFVKRFGKYGLIGLAIFLIHQHGIGEGKDKSNAEVARRVEEATNREHERYLEREKETRVSYQIALNAALEARTTAPQIIREIRNAPQTACSAQPIGIERVRLLNAAIAGNLNPDS